MKVGEGFWGMLFATLSSWRRIWRRNGHTQPSLDAGAVDEGEVDSQPSAAASTGAPVWGAGGHHTEQGANQRDHDAAEPARWDYGSKCFLLVSESKSPCEAEATAYEAPLQSTPAKNPTWKSCRPKQGKPLHTGLSSLIKASLLSEHCMSDETNLRNSSHKVLLFIILPALLSSIKNTVGY